MVAPAPVLVIFTIAAKLARTDFSSAFRKASPGEAAGTLLGRRRMMVSGRYRSSEAILAWAETGRSAGLKGSLGGLSGGPDL